MSPKPLERQLAITNKAGLHARAAALLVQTSSRFALHIEVEKDGETVNGKSIMGVMMLAAVMGTTITVRVAGPDAEAALAALVALVEGKFGEE